MKFLRLAEEIAMGDVLSGGRLDIDDGRGYQRVEFERFRVDQGDARAVTHESVASSRSGRGREHVLSLLV